jgi:hypothetical protein
MKTNSKNQSFGMLFASLCIVFFFVSTYASASVSITGRVLDKDEQPIVYATVTIISPVTGEIVEGDMCDDNGNFIIEKVQPGEYILSVRNVGFEKDETRIVTVDVTKGSIAEDDIILKESIELLNEIEVTAKSESVATEEKSGTV